jgi:uncharacterized RDD family membrane protein YckC
MHEKVAIRTGESVALEFELAGLGSRFLALCVDLLIQGAIFTALIIAYFIFMVTIGQAEARLHVPPALAQSLPAAIVIALIVCYLLLAFAFNQAGVRLHLPRAITSALPIALFSILIFILTTGYFIIFEMWWDGRSPGKRALGLRVIRDAGFPIDWGASVIRNLVRIVEGALGFYALSAISVLLSKENKRLGDIAAGTIVIRDSAYVAPDYESLAASLQIPLSDP